MGILLDQLSTFFIEEEWDYQVVEGRNILRLSFSGENGHWPCFAQAREAQQQVVVYSICPLRVPEPRRQAMGEFLMRANYGLIVGNFEMDYEDGEVRYKTSLDIEDAEATPPLLRHIIYGNVSSMDRYLPGILSMIAGNQTPLEAVAQIEDDTEPDLSKS